MRFFRPRSFLLMVLLGFGFVSLPLIVALVNAEISVERFVRQSAQTVVRAVSGTRESRLLIEQILSQERKVRQYHVLGDKNLLLEAVEKHKEIQETFGRLAAFPLEMEFKKNLESLRIKEKSLFETFKIHTPGSADGRAALDEFVELNELARKIFSESSKLIVNEVNALKNTAGKARQVLIWQMAGLVSCTILFVVLFSLLISRPIRQIDQGISLLGDGDFSSPIRVTGSQDLEFLGERLNWLRIRLAELEEEKAKFVAHVSHELKTPLASIREGSELLGEEVVGPLTGQQREIAAIVIKNSIQLQKLIENLFSFNTLLAKETVLYRAELTLDQIVSDVVDDQKPVILKKELSLDINLESVILHGDRKRLYTVVDNLLSNAVKFTPAGGTIALTLECQDDSAVLDVKDTGPGIHANERERIFEPFFQGQSPNLGHIKGTGLGLAIAKEYVLAHGGALELVQDNEPGAHFRVHLPLI